MQRQREAMQRLVQALAAVEAKWSAAVAAKLRVDDCGAHETVQLLRGGRRQRIFDDDRVHRQAQLLRLGQDGIGCLGPALRLGKQSGVLGRIEKPHVMAQEQEGRVVDEVLARLVKCPATDRVVQFERWMAGHALRQPYTVDLTSHVAYANRNFRKRG